MQTAEEFYVIMRVNKKEKKLWNTVTKAVAIASMLECEVKLTFNGISLHLYSGSDIPACVKTWEKKKDSLVITKNVE